MAHLSGTVLVAVRLRKITYIQSLLFARYSLCNGNALYNKREVLL